MAAELVTLPAAFEMNTENNAPLSLIVGVNEYDAFVAPGIAVPFFRH
jgi:hypothetical protein